MLCFSSPSQSPKVLERIRERKTGLKTIRLEFLGYPHSHTVPTGLVALHRQYRRLQDSPGCKLLHAHQDGPAHGSEAKMSQLLFPSIYLLSTNIDPDQMPDLQSQIPSLTYDIDEAEVIVGKISRKQRALFELRRLKIVTEEVVADDTSHPPPAKRRKLSNDALPKDDASTASDEEDRPTKGVVQVVKLSWFTDSVSQGEVLPLDGYLLYRGLKQSDQHSQVASAGSPGILKCTKDDAEQVPAPVMQKAPHTYSLGPHHSRTVVPLKRPALIQETTSEHDIDQHPPPIPDFLHTVYSCQRPTLPNPPNSAFIEQLKEIRATRALLGDKIGVRAYSTCIAAVAAYPHMLSNRRGTAGSNLLMRSTLR